MCVSVSDSMSIYKTKGCRKYKKQNLSVKDSLALLSLFFVKILV